MRKRIVRFFLGGAKVSTPKKGFTLAEVLICLSIIGIVASVTLPALQNSYQEQATVARLKKFLNTMNAAFKQSQLENGPISTWGLKSSGEGFNYDMESPDFGATKEAVENIDSVMESKLLPYLKINSYCKPSSNKCASYKRKSLDGSNFGSLAERIVLPDGSIINGLWFREPNCTSVVGSGPELKNVCGEIFYDTNGRKPPNQVGKDVFLFWFTKYGVVPMGLSDDTTVTFAQSCNVDKVNAVSNGYGCAAWVIYNENMDYLRCKGLSWSGKTSCK